MARCGVVVVGRNEGERLRRCLASVAGLGLPTVYVDSCSTDGSAALARSTGVLVLELDSSTPLSAARARNAGFAHLLERYPDITYVQFVDGDCELCPGWVEAGLEAIENRADLAIVCGRVIERDPDASIYNTLCALEWQREPGEILACGGIFLARAEAFRSVEGFRSDVMAAEDNELCLRLRGAGWKILAIDVDMVRHDAAILRFGQWWTRARRAGMAFTLGAAMHGASAERHFRRQCQRIWLWAFGVPLASILLSVLTHGWGLLGFFAYPLLVLRIYAYGRKRGWSPKQARLYALFTVIAKWPELLGAIHYYRRTRWTRLPLTLIEYKHAKKAA